MAKGSVARLRELRETKVSVPKPQKIKEAKQAVINVVINKASPSNAETHRERSKASMSKLRAKKKDHGTA